MPDISITVRGLPAVKDFIDQLPRNVRGVATEAAAVYFIGDGRRGLKHYPAYKYVTRRSAFGVAFFSAKQRRYVMARIREGSIDPGAPHRTGNFQRSWHTDGEGARTRIIGTLPHEQWPDRLTEKVGWRAVDDILSTNYKGAIRASQAAVNMWLKTRKR
jgi:hypothetical protein